MAAVAAEPGAAAAAASTTTVGDGLEYESEPGEHVVGLEPDSAAGFVPKMEPCHQAESVDAVQECSQVRMEMRRPDLRVAGKALCVQAEDGHSDTEDRVPTECMHNDTGVAEERLEESFSLNAPAANNEVSAHESVACFPPCSSSDPEPSADFSHYVPTPAFPETEPGLFVTETDELAHNNSESVYPADLEHDFAGSETASDPEAASDAPCSDFRPAEDAFHERLQSPKSQSTSPEETSFTESLAQSCTSDSSNISSKDSVQLPAVTDPLHTSLEPDDESLVVCDSGVSSEPEHKVCAETVDSKPEAICGLVPGSEVRVSLDHIIDDALVVSFRLGEKIFSGVLMDLSKR